MTAIRVAKTFIPYGAWGWSGKVLAAMLALAGPAWGEEITILAMGDSLTQGYGLPEAEGFVPQMQAWLDQEGEEVRLINAGVSGETTAGGARRIDWALGEEVDAMILNLGGNDFLRGIDPAVTRANLDAILQAAEARGVEVLLVGLVANGNYGADYKTRFDALYPELAEARGAQLYPYFFDGLGRGSPQDFLPYFQPDAIHPNAEGVAKIVEHMGPYVQALIDAAED